MAYREIDFGTVLELPALQPKVFVDGWEYQHATCFTAERKLGVAPGQAVLRFDASNIQDSPITLNALNDKWGYSAYPKFGSRIKLKVEDKDIWRGWLVRRVDNGENDSVIWYAFEDQWLLSKVWLRGCLVLDPDETITPSWKRVKYVESFTPRVNPGGLWNCQNWPIRIDGKEYDIPIFAPKAKKQMNYESPENTDVNLEAFEGDYCAWTTRRFLLYLCAMLRRPEYIPNSEGAQGIGNDDYGVFTPLATINRKYLKWDFDSVTGMVGYDPALKNKADPSDPLDRKLPDINFQGMAYTSALRQVLNVMGTHEMRVEWEDKKSQTEETEATASMLSFAPIGWSGAKNGTLKKLKAQRKGPIESVDTVVGFDLIESIENYYETVAVDGAPVKIETSLTCKVLEDEDDWSTEWEGENAKKLSYWDPESILIPAWTPEEELAFKQCIYGAKSGAYKQGTYAMYPETPGNTDFDKFLIADGKLQNAGEENQSARLSIAPKSERAVQLAMESFPTVFRAFRINSKKLEELKILWGYKKITESLYPFENDKRYAKLHYNRPIYPNQLQYLIHDLGYVDETTGKTGQGHWIRDRLPLRISIQISKTPDNTGVPAEDKKGPLWIDVPYQGGVRVTGDGILWLDNLGPAVFPRYECILQTKDGQPGGGRDWYRTFDIMLRTFKINAAFPHESRVTGIKTKTNAMLISETFSDAIGNPLLYVDSVDAFNEYHQLNSEPTANPRYLGFGTDDTAKDPVKNFPINRLVPPGSERYSAEFNAQRKLVLHNRPMRQTSWRLPGINLGYIPGDFIDIIEMVGLEVTEQNYEAKSAVPTVTYDFANQKTELGGLASVIAGND